MPALAEEDLPIYRRIAEDLLRRIGDGDLAPGARVPSERELSDAFGVSRMTARQALRLLVARGLIESRLGLGYFVARPRIDQRLQTLTSFSQDMRRLGRRPASVVLRRETLPATPEEAAALAIAVEEPVHRLERVRLADAQPVALETTVLPRRLAPDLFDRADFGRESLYAVLERDFAVVPLEAEQTLQAGVPDPLTARALDMPVAAPVLRLTRRTFDRRGTPVEYVRSCYRGDRYTMHIRLAPGEGAAGGRPAADAGEEP